MKMKNLIFLLVVCASCFCFSQEEMKTIKGTISDDFGTLANVSISVKGSEEKIFTDAEGKYSIQAQKGDVLVYESQGRRTFEIIIEDVTRILNLTMRQEVEELDEVIVKNEKPKSAFELLRSYDTDEKLIVTSSGFLNGESLGSATFIQAEEITPGSLCILDILRKAPGVDVRGDCTRGGIVVIRGRSSIVNPQNAVFEVDGILTNDVPLWIVPSNIKRIAVLRSLADTNRYGGNGVGGVVVINTKNIVNSFDSEIGKPFDRAKLRDNTFTGDAIGTANTFNDKSSAVVALYNETSLDQAKALFQEQVKTRNTSYFYILDSYTFFTEKWNDYSYADKIINEHYQHFNDNPLALKSLAYLYQTQNKLDEAQKLFKKIFVLRPNYAQSYMDLANSYRDIEDYRKAASIYARYNYLLEEGFLKAEGEMFTNSIERDLNNLVSLNGGQFLSEKEMKNAIVDEDFKGTRLVFEWTDSEAEFELQFVNPDNKYFKSEHSLVADEKKIKDEKLSGYSSEEFLIDDSIKGMWMVNIKYFGNKSLTPSYIKASIYHDYGTTNQRKETKLFKMSLKNVNQKWFMLSKAESIPSR